MDNENEDGGSDSRESYGLKISELLKALAERKSPPRDTTHIDPRNISTTLSILRNTGTGTPNSHGTFRARAVLPANISLLSTCQFKRRDHLGESLQASVPGPAPDTALASSQQGQLQPRSPPLNPVLLAHLVERSKVLPSDSLSSIGEQLKKREIHPHILGVQAWTRPPSWDPRQMPPKVSPHTGPTSEWFFENLMDLQWKLYLGASKKYGAWGKPISVTHLNPPL